MCTHTRTLTQLNRTTGNGSHKINDKLFFFNMDDIMVGLRAETKNLTES